MEAKTAVLKTKRGQMNMSLDTCVFSIILIACDEMHQIITTKNKGSKKFFEPLTLKQTRVEQVGHIQCAAFPYP
jgi:hypothetical protein